ncbi:MAG: hypothetical protein JHD15_18720 [Phenylobacterium sp.]|uniref:hypothetical protein n=1 Tax=Phenylobacterium sp. TaxID=1871053 RepID=UPI001A2F345C|nr:hypothetical protein [Phenylobacterium sp.]MBJ7412375.1 hypothetical protein [Phenylobacterium sp.]
MEDALTRFIAGVRSLWGPLSSELVVGCRDQLAALAASSPQEPWLADLHRTRPDRRVLHRDPDHGFVLLAHTESAGLFRPPHDHGRGWVVYALQRGEIEMRTYGRVEDEDGKARLVQRDSTIMRSGQALAYLPGDIHDTRCLSDTALLFRFTERDLKVEDREGQLTRYADRDGAWVDAGA